MLPHPPDGSLQKTTYLRHRAENAISIRDRREARRRDEESRSGGCSSTTAVPFAFITSNAKPMLKSILTLLAIFLLIKLFFPELASAVQHVLGLMLGLLERLLNAAAGQIP